MSQSIDISSLKIVAAGELQIVLRDDNNTNKQKLFLEWYESKKHWEISNPDSARAIKMKNLPWEGTKSSKIWDLFQQGAVLSDGRPVVYCILCHKIYPHTALVGTSTAQGHLKAKEHTMKAKELLFDNAYSESEVKHHELVAKLRQAGSTGILVKLSSSYFLVHQAN